MPTQDVFIAQTAEQAHLLLDHLHFSLLYLLQAPHHATALADLTRRPLRQVHHQLTRLLGADLITVVAERPRAGRPVKLYQASHSRYQVPFGLTRHADRHAAVDQFSAIFSDFCSAYLTRLAPETTGMDVQITVLPGDEGVHQGSLQDWCALLR